MIDGNTIKSANKHSYRTLAEARERVHLDKSVKAVNIGTKDNIANAMTKQEQGRLTRALRSSARLLAPSRQSHRFNIATDFGLGAHCEP